MFLLKSIEVINHDKEILKATFTEKDKEDREKPFSTLILGENGTGKSFLLKTIAITGVIGYNKEDMFTKNSDE